MSRSIPQSESRNYVPLYLILFPTFLLLAIFCLIPFIWAFVTSFYEYEVGAPAHFVGLSNYSTYLFHDHTLGESLGNMAFLTLFAVVVTVIVPLTIAKLIFSLSSPRASYVYRILFLIPILVPSVAVQLIWKDFIYSGTGLLNQFLNILHLSNLTRGWLSSPHTVLTSIAFIGFPFANGIQILIYYAGLTSISDSVHEAAFLDGATGVRKFLTIDVPLVLSQIKLLVILTLIGGIQSFESLFILTRGGPGFKSTVPGLWMYFNAFSFQKMGYACSIGVLLFLLILVLTVINLKFFRSSEDVTAASI
ncbi:MAG TPA: sugar ABC transporter permease [Tepidisphaeraceae bacterium]|jgi:raffinose/stachyose/melibiose transport system permease protein|nr:sugar ABC transporter permease [Tepidisphaeraceae bacterium]